MSRPVRSLSPAAAEARAALPADDAAAIDRLVPAVLAAPSAAPGAVLRSRLPGMAGVPWLGTAGLPPTTCAGETTPEQWSKDPAAPHRSQARGGPQPRGRRTGGGRPSAHGHAPGAQAAPRWH